MLTQPMNETQLRRFAPSIYSDGVHESRSQQYVQISTNHLLAGLRQEGFEPFYAAQAGVRHASRIAFAKHVVRLRHVSQQADEAVNEIVLINSHDGSCAYRMLAGCYRFVCANGLICGETFDDVRVTHRGDIQQNIIEGAYRILSQSQAMTISRQAMQLVQLSDHEESVFAQAALKLRFPERYLDIQSAQALRRLRQADLNTDLWTVFNIVQEHLIKGGLLIRTPSNRLTRSRAIKSIDTSTRLNRDLWTLAERWMQAKAA